MRRMRFCASLLLCLLLIGARLLGEKVSTMPAPAGYVDDYAGVLSRGAQERTEALCRQVHDRTGAQIFVVTVHTLEGQPIAAFANDLFHTWKIGDKKTDRGVLLLFAIEDRKRRIEVGYGLEGALNDAKAGDIGREMVPSLQQKNYDGAVELGVREVAAIVAADAGVSLAASAAAAAPVSHAAESTDPATVFFVILMVLVALALVTLIVVLRRRRREAGEQAESPELGLGPEPVLQEGTGPVLRPTRELGFVPPLRTASAAPRVSQDDTVAWSPGYSSSDSGTSFSSDSGFSGGGGGDSGGGGADGSW